MNAVFDGPTDLYLSIAPGQPTHDLLAWRARALAPGSGRRSCAHSMRMSRHPSHHSGGSGAAALSHFPCDRSSATARLALVCSLRKPVEARKVAKSRSEVSQVAELERELERRNRIARRP